MKSQIWVGLCIYLLVAITEKRLGIQRSLYTFLRILEVNIFEKKPVTLLVSEAFKQTDETLYAARGCICSEINRTVVMAGFNRSEEYIRQIVALGKMTGVEKISLFPYHEGGKSKSFQLGRIYGFCEAKASAMKLWRD